MEILFKKVNYICQRLCENDNNPQWEDYSEFEVGTELKEVIEYVQFREMYYHEKNHKFRIVEDDTTRTLIEY